MQTGLDKNFKNINTEILNYKVSKKIFILLYNLNLLVKSHKKTQIYIFKNHICKSFVSEVSQKKKQS